MHRELPRFSESFGHITRKVMLALSNLKIDIYIHQSNISFISDSTVIKLLAFQLICAFSLYISAMLWPLASFVAESCDYFSLIALSVIQVCPSPVEYWPELGKLRDQRIFSGGLHMTIIDKIEGRPECKESWHWLSFTVLKSVTTCASYANMASICK